jgi:2-hydroxychromene-2-carboxylate isomerase
VDLLALGVRGDGGHAELIEVTQRGIQRIQRRKAGHADGEAGSSGAGDGAFEAVAVEGVAARHRADLVYQPFLLGGLFKSIGTPDVPLFAMPLSKQRFMNEDMHRWAARRGVPLRFPSRFPMNTVKALRMTLQVPTEARAPLVAALMRAYWVDDRDLNEPAELVAIAREAGFDGEALVAGAAGAAAKDALYRATAEAEATVAPDSIV